MDSRANTWARLREMTGFDWFVLAGAGINILVVLYLFGYWLLFT
jgi:hypothetical protein